MVNGALGVILAFPMWRRGFAKVTGSVIDEAIRRGHDVALMWDLDDKPGEAVRSPEIRAQWPAAKIVRSPYRPADVVIGDPSIGECSTAPVPTFALDFVWEHRMRPAVPGVTRCWSTAYQRDAFARHDFTVARTCSGCDEPVTGMTALDALPLVDADAVRARYTLDRPYLLLFSLKFGVPRAWRRWLSVGRQYPWLLAALRAYCERRGWLLVVKTRVKHRDPGSMARVADRVIADDDLWPYTSAALVKGAALVVHFQSGAVFEAAAAGVPQLSIAVPQPHLAHLGGHGVFFATTPGNLQHWPGVVQSAADMNEARAMVMEDRVMTAVREDALATYAERYTGPLDGRSAARVLDVVEARCP